MTMQSKTQFLHADPNDVDKIMANELNALSFNDREALNEEMHGVRSLAPNETPEMIEDALFHLQKEIIIRLRLVLSSLPSLPHDNGSRQAYLGELLSASEFYDSSSDANYPMTVEVQSNSSVDLSPPISYSLEEAFTVFVSDEGTSTSSNDKDNSKSVHTEINHKYSYALSDGFKIKFLRAELFDVTKAAARYVKCIDFLVNYFGLAALERPLRLQDLDKEEQKLLKEGRCQLMPSRDRFGRRILVFQGAVGKGFSHRNIFKVVMYNVFQVASEDEMTQRKGLVAIFTNHDFDAMHIIKLAYHQTESIKFFDAAPLRYSAFHFFLPERFEIFKQLVLNMIGKKVRLITRAHIVSSVIDTSYTLRCFGIPTEDYPVTSSGSIKTKNLMKWFKFRIALEEAQARGDKLSSQPFLGVECPQIDSVIFRNGGSAWDRPGNIKFQEILTKMEPCREHQKTMAEKNAFLDKIIMVMVSSGLSFLLYDEKKDWYVELSDSGLLRKKVFQALRDQSARRKRRETGRASFPENKQQKIQQRSERQRSKGSKARVPANHQVNESSTNIFLELCNVKRRKMSEATNSWV